MKQLIIIGLAISLFNLLIHILILNDYGLSWDFHYHYYAGLHHLGLTVPELNTPSKIPFTSPDPRLTVSDPFGPFTQIIPTLSKLIFYDRLHLLQLDAAYNLPMIFFGSFSIGLLFIFLAESMNITIGLLSAIMLSLLPVFFGYLHNDMKDIPNAFFFTLTIYLFWRLVKYHRFRDMLLASLAFAIAFNFKINSIFIPVICLFYIICIYWRKITQNFQNHKHINKELVIIMLFFPISIIGAVLLWVPFWEHPITKILQLPYFYSHNTLNMPVLFLGKIIRSGVNIPFIYPYIYLAVTTPLPILFFFLSGLVLAVNKIFTDKKNKEILLLIIFWFFIPLLRFFDPQMGAIDGVRHFLEVVFPLCAIAGFGAKIIIDHIKLKKDYLIQIILITLILISLIRNIILYHPYQTSFFNMIIGGIRGAEGKLDIDFWGTPQKEAINWLNKTAPLNSSVYIVMAQSSAAMYLRDDLLNNLNTKPLNKSDYVIMLNRRSFFTFPEIANYIADKNLNLDAIYKREVEGVSLVWIFPKNK